MTLAASESSHAEYLPAAARPPHDPFRLPLNATNSWSVLSLHDVEVNPRSGNLALSPIPATGPSLTDPSGTFGGVTTPRNIAIGSDQSVWLLDTEELSLMRFDPCRCEFEQAPCIGGFGHGARQWDTPGGIGICGGNLYIADTGNSRLQVFALHGLVLRALWAPPPGAGLASEWQPVDVAFDGRGQVLVGDKANGCVHVFNAAGCWIRCIENVGAVEAIVTDCSDKLYVLVAGKDTVDVFDITTTGLLERVGRVDAIVDRFAICPIAINSTGELNLGSLCKPPANLTFDDRGYPVTPDQSDSGPKFPLEGTAIIGPLDSRLFRCQWDRLVATADLEEGASVTVDTFTAGTRLSESHILNLSDDRWATAQSFDHSQLRDCVWDCLIRSEESRFMWLRLTLRSDGTVSPQLCDIVVEYPRISLRRYLPAIVGAEKASADFTDRFLGIVDRTQREIEATLDNQAQFFDPMSAPAEPPQRDFLSWLASWVDVTLERHLPLARRRALLKSAGKLFCRRGTVGGLRSMLTLYLGLPESAEDCPPLPPCGPCTLAPAVAWQPPTLILEHFQLRRWMFLCRGRLGDQARLWGQSIVNRSQLGGHQLAGNAQLDVSQLITTQDPFRDPFHVYAHKYSVFLPACFGRTESMRNGLRRLMSAEGPAHAVANLVYVEPRMRIGTQSMIGYDTVIGCYPSSNVWLEDSGRDEPTRLGRATVLGPARRGGPTTRVGQNARVGTTTRL